MSLFFLYNRKNAASIIVDMKREGKKKKVVAWLRNGCVFHPGCNFFPPIPRAESVQFSGCFSLSFSALPML